MSKRTPKGAGEENAIDLMLSERGEMMGVVSDFLTELQSGMSAYQINTFVLNDIECPTPDAKYSQCLRELWTRYQALHDARKQWAITKAKIRLATARIGKFESLAKAAEADSRWDAEEYRARADIQQARLEAHQLMLLMITKGVGETLREMDAFYAAYLQAKTDRRFETIEEAEESTWFARIAMRIKYKSQQGIPPLTGANRQRIEQLIEMIGKGIPDDALLREAAGVKIELAQGPQVFKFGRGEQNEPH